MNWRMLGVFSAALAVSFAALGAEDSGKIDFQKDVAPLLKQHCVDCHGPELQMAELRLDQRRFVLGGEANPDLVKPGRSGESLLVQRLTDRKLGIVMPPTFPFFPNERVGLPDKQIAILKAWIDQGAAWPEGVSMSAETKLDQSDRAAKALFAAIRAGDLAGVRSLVEGSKELANARDRRGSTPLMQAAMYGDAALLGYLLDHGAEVNATNDDGATALMRAAGDYDKVNVLLERGAKVDAKSALGRTPVLIAANFPGNTRTVKLLIERGANVKDQDPFGDTCLTAAAKRGDVEMVKALVAAGADLFAGGRPPLAWAAEEGNLETVVCLLEHGAGKVKEHVSLALSAAAARGPHEAVRLLLEHGGDPNSPMCYGGYTPLMVAAYSENCDAASVRLLLEKGANAAAVGGGGRDAAEPGRQAWVGGYRFARTRRVESGGDGWVSYGNHRGRAGC